MAGPIPPMSHVHRDRLRLFSTAGTQESFGVGMYNNNYVNQGIPEIMPNVFLIPMMSANTGTVQYYGQSDKTIFVIYARPFISMLFTANTHVFTSDTRMVYMRNDVHKIDYGMARAYQTEPNDLHWQVVRNRIAAPVIVYTANTNSGSSDVTSAFTYTMLPEQLIKPDGRFTEEVFEDRGQYFLNNRFVFTNTATTFASTFTLNNQDNLVSYPYSSITNFITTGHLSRITQGPWSGEVAHGLFFTCFQPPGKPIIEFPFPPTATTNNFTFTPTFNFSNVEDGDEYVLEVTYNLSDTGFTDTISTTGVTQYRRNRTADSLEELTNKTSNVPVGDEVTLTRRTRRINVALVPGSEYIYRIGNSKSIINIFGIKNEIINYSGYYSAITGTHQVINLVVDSKTVSSPSTASTANPSSHPTDALVVR